MATTTFTPTANSDGSGAVTNVANAPVAPSTLTIPPTPTSVTPSTPSAPIGQKATIPSITPAPPAPTSPIPTNTITGTPNLNLPPPTPSATQGPANALIGASASVFTPPETALLGATDNNAANATENYNNSVSGVQGLINTYLGEGADEQNQMNAAGVPQLRATSNSLTSQYNAQNAAYTAQYATIMNGTGTLEQKEQSITNLQAAHGTQLASIAAQQSIAQNDYTNALNTIQTGIQIKYGPLKDSIGFMEDFVNNNKDILTEQQQNQFNANLAVQSQQYTQGTFYDQLNATTGMQMVQDAAKQGADSATLAKMGELVSSGASFSDVASASNGFLGNSTYTIAFNQDTGKMEPFNSTTGKWQSGATGSPTTTYDATDPNSVNTVTGTDWSTYNFNASGYNTADPNYGLKLNQNVQNIQSQFGNITTPGQAQAVIDKLAPTSTLTGAMVMSAAQSAGIDPTTLLAQLQNESLCGSSNVAVADNNCGGISYVGQADATKGTARPASEGGNYAHFDTVQDGLNAQAALIAKAKVAANTNANPAQSTLPQVQIVQSLQQSLPSNVGQAFNYLPATGSGYLDLSKVSDPPGAPSGTGLSLAKDYAAKYNLPELNADQVAAVQDANTALSQINHIEAAWNAVASTGAVSGSVASVTNQLSTAFHAQNADAIKEYLNLVPTAISTLNQITGSKRLTQFTDELSVDSMPILPGFGEKKVLGIGGTFDTSSEGITKINNLKQDINSSITSIDPRLQGAPLSSTTPTSTTYNAGGVTYKQGADGLYYPQ